MNQLHLIIFSVSRKLNFWQGSSNKHIDFQMTEKKFAARKNTSHILIPNSRSDLFFSITYFWYSLFLYQNVCCGYLLKAPLWGISNEYHNIFFCEEIRKSSTWITSLSGTKLIIGTEKKIIQ